MKPLLTRLDRVPVGLLGDLDDHAGLAPVAAHLGGPESEEEVVSKAGMSTGPMYS